MATKSNIVRIGDVEIMALSDGMLEFDLCNFFPTIPEEQWQPHASKLTDEHKVRFNLGSYLIRSSGRTILVDTGLGPRPAETPDVPWGELLREGERWVPTFPRAKYWMSKTDWDTSHRPDVQPQRYPNAPTCVWPLQELGLIEFMHGEHSITRELTAVPTPGHTPGHVSLLITSQGQRALVLGDAAHSPVQFEEPDWVSRADMDPELTRQTRRALLDRLEREEILVMAGHFPAPGLGRVVRLDGRRYWRGL